MGIISRQLSPPNLVFVTCLNYLLVYLRSTSFVPACHEDATLTEDKYDYNQRGVERRGKIRGFRNEGQTKTPPASRKLPKTQLRKIIYVGFASEAATRTPLREGTAICSPSLLHYTSLSPPRLLLHAPPRYLLHVPRSCSHPFKPPLPFALIYATTFLSSTYAAQCPRSLSTLT